VGGCEETFFKGTAKLKLAGGSQKRINDPKKRVRASLRRTRAAKNPLVNKICHI
jgi:hypothetical protein